LTSGSYTTSLKRRPVIIGLEDVGHWPPDCADVGRLPAAGAVASLVESLRQQSYDPIIEKLGWTG
jgi:hypothetical protein